MYIVPRSIFVVFSAFMFMVSVSCADKKLYSATGLNNTGVRDVTVDGATLTWSGSAESYEVLIDGYKHLSERPIYRASGLKPNTLYEWKVRAQDSGKVTEWIEGEPFRTLREENFPPPSNLGLTDITDDSVLLVWSGGDCMFEVDIAGIGGITSAKSYQVMGLSPGVHYTWYVRAFEEGRTSEWVEGPDFITPP